MSLSSYEIFNSLREEGLPLFLSYSLAFPLLGYPSERALAASVRRLTCPVEADEQGGRKGFRLAKIAAWQAGDGQKKQRGRPTVEQRIASRGQK